MEFKSRFNEQHYKRVYAARENARDELYCFATRQKLGKNGKLKEHPLYGQKFKSLLNFKVYTVDSVNIHFWNGGYYYFVVLVDEGGSSAPRHWENINSTDGMIIEFIQETQEQYEPFPS